jgi:hypothetical protein
VWVRGMELVQGNGVGYRYGVSARGMVRVTDMDLVQGSGAG